MFGWTKCFREERDQHNQLLLDKSGKLRTGLATGVGNMAITDLSDKSGFAEVVWVKVYFLMNLFKLILETKREGMRERKKRLQYVVSLTD